MTEHLPDLVVRQMHIIWRDTFVTEDPHKDFLAASREHLRNLPCYVSDSQAEPTGSQPERLRVIERVSRSAASIGHPDLLRFQFEPFYLTDLRPTLRHLRCPPESLTSGLDLGAFAAEHAATLRGIGAMDSYYRERAPWLVARDMGGNIGPDKETAVYLLGNSELILCNEDIDRVSKMVQKRLHLSTQDLAATYLYMHYEVLLEWIYLQDAILRAYIQRLDTLIAAPTPRRVEMIDALQGALSDLVHYREGITPFATRVEFLEQAGAHHKLDDLAATFERKQELLLNYSSEYYDYREARASEFLNWLAAILAGGELANLIINAAGIAPNENVTLYLSVMGCFSNRFLLFNRSFDKRPKKRYIPPRAAGWSSGSSLGS